MSNPVLLGANVDPASRDPQEPFRRARTAERGGLDLITIMDHPYNRNLFDTWTLLTALAQETERVHLGTNVLSTPLRPPAMLAKMAASLDVLSGGRLELGVGAGAYWPGIAAFGGPERSPGEAFEAFEDVLHILRGMWDQAGGTFSYEGRHHRVQGARPGPAPAHRIRLWTGAYGPRMLRLTGRLADGVLVSKTYRGPDKLDHSNQLIDEGAREAGRAPDEIRRGYNLMGVLDLGRADTRLDDPEPGHIVGDARHWAAEIVQLYRDHRQDTFIFWPVAGDERLQIEAFAAEVAPPVREALGG